MTEHPHPNTTFARAIASLDGLSVGDAFGELFFAPERSDYFQTGPLPAGPWPYTDDTEMALSVVAVLREHGRIDADALAARFVAHYDRTRGYGPSMHRVLRSIGEGVPWQEAASGQFEGQGSFGNGAAMRAGPIGAYFADDLDRVVEEAARSAQVTHAHPEGVAGAIAVAVAAALAADPDSPAGDDFLDAVASLLPASDVTGRIRKARRLSGNASHAFAVSVLGNGTGLSAQDTVPYALWCVAHHLGDFEAALWHTVRGLGDRDTTCAIVGSIVACRTGTEGIPAAWRVSREPLPAWHLNSAST